MLPELYKGVFFVLLAKYYLSRGEYIKSRSELLPLLTEMDGEMLAKSMALKNCPAEARADEYFDAMLRWCSNIMEWSEQITSRATG
jgi:type IV secretory pathway TrbF-like protein